MDQAEQIRLIREIGTAGTVFMVLALSESCGETMCANLLGINQYTARRHLRLLVSLGLCERTGYFSGYKLTELGKELTRAFNAGEADTRAFNAGEADTRAFNAGEADTRAFNADMRAFNAGEALTTTTTKLTLSKDIEVVEVDPQPALNARVSAQNARVEDRPEIQAKWEALRDAGIFRNSTTEKLVAMEHVTPEFIRAHAAAYKPKNGNGKGILILRLENNEPVPEAEPKQSYSDWQDIAGDCEDTPDDCQDPEPEEVPQGEAQAIWGMALQALELQMPKTQFEAYIRPITAMGFDCGRLTLQAPNSEACSWLDSRIKRTLENILPGITGDDVAVEFTHLSTVENQSF